MRRCTLGLFATAVLLLVTGAPAAAGGVSVDPRIIGGTTVDATTVPWTVALLQSGIANGFNAQFCGGTLVHTRWVLTAAHCVKGTSPSAIDVAWGISDLNAIGAGDRHAVSSIIVHPQYNASANTSDVALLELTAAATGATVLPLNADPAFPALNQSLDTYGWGNTMYPGTSYPNLLHGVTIQDRAGPTSTGSCGLYGSEYIGDHMVCGGVSGGGKDACQGDSGGPLVATNASNQRVLVGATSWGNGCALASYPGLWSRVSSYEDWVDQQINAPATPRVHIGNATVVEGDVGNRTAYFTVTASPAPKNAMSVGYLTAGLGATSGTDFTAKAATLSFAAGQNAKTISVAVRPDATGELTEDFRVLLATPSGLDGATLVTLWGTGTILDDDSVSGNQLTVGDATTREGDDGSTSTTVKVQVALTAAAGVPFTVPYATVAGTAGTRDYTAKSGTLSFSSTARTKMVTITIAREWIPEANESFTLALGTPSTGTVTVTRPTATFTIVNDD